MKNEIRILLLEDSARDLDLIRHALQDGGISFSLVWSDNRETFVRQLAESPPDLILSDFSLPSLDGYTALDLARRSCPDAPFIFVTGTLGEEVAIETLKKGATDYVLKHHLSRLAPSVQRALREAKERAERRRAEEELRRSHEQLRALSIHLQHVREAERTRIAREVHDELGQALTGLKLQLAWLAGRLPKKQRSLYQRTRTMSERIDQTILAIRRIATELRPGVLDTAGLLAALEWQANEFQTQTGIRCEVQADVKRTITNPELTTTFFRIFQETLTNVIRHAEATRVDVRLTEEGQQMVLEVKDNGLGITEDEIHRTESIGILGMRERASLLGGEVRVQGEPGRGTTVRVQLSCPPETAPTPSPSHENPHRRRSRRGSPRAEADSG